MPAANQHLEFPFKTKEQNMSIGNNVVLTKWEELKTLVATLEVDVAKNATGNSAAGVRARKGLRTLKQTTSDLVKLTLGKSD